ncbi:MAG TPA: sugar transferase [Thermoanaerobaculia bacterium]|jgi:exopolysaccharide biosynthesis polyprenyl glycosylphosphotransferase|nr:sugar transferase [Thermoanaerobaculia bacterium]
MLKQKARAIALGVLAGDLALTALSLPVAYMIRHGVLTSISPTLFPTPLHPFDRYLFLLVLILPFWTVMLSVAGFYRSHRTLPLAEEIWGATKVAFGGTAVLALVVYGLRLEFVSRWLLVVFAIVNFAFLATEKVALRLLSRWVRARGYNFRTVLLVGTGQKAAQLADFLEAHPHWGFRVMGYLDDDNGGEIRRAARWPCVGRITDFEAVLLREVVDEVVFVIEKGKLGAYEEALLVAERHGVPAHVSLDIFPHILARPVLEELDGVPLLSFTTTPSNPTHLVIKRALDLAVSLFLFVVTLPIQLLAAIAIKLTSSGPVFFRQVRCGLNGRHFTLLKFRTMDAGAEQRLFEVSHLNEMSGPVFKMSKDPRLTMVGRILRRLSIDELPQLVNVIRGDMSLVGPRPPLPEEVAHYEPWQRRRLSMNPGLTCLWQVSGRNEVDFDRWMALDLKYIDTWSPMLDLKILLKTVPAVLSGRGAR